MPYHNTAFEGDNDDPVTLGSVVTVNGTDEVKLEKWNNARDSSSSSSGMGSEPDEITTTSRNETSNKVTLAVLGSGDFGRALAGRLVQAGYHVNVGSRDPERNASLVMKVGATSMGQKDAIYSSDIVIVAVPKAYYKELPLKKLEGKILVDVSNRNSVARKQTISQAEMLQELVPNASVVKGFNVLSAYALESGGIQGSKEVFVASDDPDGKSEVMSIVRASGFTPVDMGGLRSAREIEDIPVQRFQNWKSPFVVSSLIFLFFYILSVIKFQFCWTLTWGDGSWHWDLWNYLPMDTLNKTLSVHALNMLTTCYLPGVLAAYIQLIRGTKYSRFPKWLDNWLKMRKQLGLLMLFSACLHACLSVAIMAPGYHELVYGEAKKIEANLIEGNYTHREVHENKEVTIYGAKMKWRGEMFLTCGVLAFALAVILGITSLPSVTATMTWKEFSFVQSKLGWVCLILACAHNCFYGWPYMWSFESCGMPSSFQYGMYLPMLTILLKIPLLFLGSYIDKIRGGWERGKGQRHSSKVTGIKA